MENRKGKEFPDLRFLCTRTVCVQLFQVNIRWRRLPDCARSLKQWLINTRMPSPVKSAIHSGMPEVFREVQRWGDKHCDLFDSDSKKAHRGEHLRLYFGSLVWKATTIAIDDLRTAEKIMIDECADWPQMQFQFACAYVMLPVLQQRFDRIRLRAFRKRLTGHPLYDLWLNLLQDEMAWQKLFAAEGLAPCQTVSLAFQWAIAGGYAQLVQFLFARVTDAQREYIGLLQWGKMCFKARHSDVMQFLCTELCAINAVAVARITWNTFFMALQVSLEAESTGRSDERADNLRKLEFLLAHCCPMLRAGLLAAENYRGLTDAFVHRDSRTFNLFLQHLDADQLRQARERIDRVYDRRPAEDLKWFRRVLVRRQATIS